MLLRHLFCCQIYFSAIHKIPTRVFQRGCGCGLHILPTLASKAWPGLYRHYESGESKGVNKQPSYPTLPYPTMIHSGIFFYLILVVHLCVWKHLLCKWGWGRAIKRCPIFRVYLSSGIIENIGARKTSINLQ